MKLTLAIQLPEMVKIIILCPYLVNTLAGGQKHTAAFGQLMQIF